jgi:hypothetical protein
MIFTQGTSVLQWTKRMMKMMMTGSYWLTWVKLHLQQQQQQQQQQQEGGLTAAFAHLSGSSSSGSCQHPLAALQDPWQQQQQRRRVTPRVTLVTPIWIWLHLRRLHSLVQPGRHALHHQQPPEQQQQQQPQDAGVLALQPASVAL